MTGPSGLGRRAVRGFLWSSLSLLFSKLSLFGVTLVLARLLTPRQFGIVAAALSVAGLLEVLQNVGVGSALVYEQETGISHRARTAFTVSLAMSACMSAIGILASPLLAGFFHVSGSVNPFRVLFCYLFLRGGNQVQDSMLQRDMRYRERTVCSLGRAVAQGVVSLVLAYSGAGVWALIGGFLCGEAAAFVANTAFVRVLPTLRLDGAVVRSLLSFGAPVMATNIVSAMSTNGDDLIVGNRLGPTALGYYNIAYGTVEVVIDNVYWVFQQVAYPVYAKARDLGPDAIRKSMLRALRLITLFGFTAGAGLAIAAPLAIPVLFSPKWDPAVLPMVYLALGSGVASIGYASGDIFPALGRPGALLRLMTAFVFVLVAGFWFVAPYGIAYVSLVHLVFRVVYGVVRLRVANRLVGST